MEWATLEVDEEQGAMLMVLSLYVHLGRETINDLIQNVDLSEDCQKVVEIMLMHFETGVTIFPRGEHNLAALHMLEWRKERLEDLSKDVDKYGLMAL
jgi:hypothetical protein